jgi:type I restriction enzyme S subunit
VTTIQERVHGIALPAAWRLNKLHRVLRVRRGYKNTGMRERNLLSLSYGKIVKKDIDGVEGLLPESFDNYQIVEPGNIVLRLTDLQNDKRSLRQGLVHERGIITSAYDAVEVSADQDSRFWAYALLALDIAKYYYSLGGGVRQSIKFADFPNDWIAAPALAVQKAVADFLDRETARVDQLIRNKQRFASLAEVEFQSFLTGAVTVGLIPAAEMKNSGYDWSPTTPARWTATRLKFLCRHIVDCLHETPEHSDEGEFPSIRTADISRGSVSVATAKRVSASVYMHRIQRLEPKENDILYTREGERFGLAALVPPDTKLCLGQRMMMFRTNGTVLPSYLMWSLNGDFAYNYLKRSIGGATSPHLNIFDIRNVPIFLPPEAEQAHINALIDVRFARKQRLIRLVSRSIGKLQEYRSALITAAVNGQIDVSTSGEHSIADRRLDHIEEAMTA